MPFASKSQAKFMFSQKPKMAKEWAAETPSITALPNKVKKTDAGMEELSKPSKPRK